MRRAVTSLRALKHSPSIFPGACSNSWSRSPSQQDGYVLLNTCKRPFCSSGGGVEKSGGGVSVNEAKRLLRQIHVQALKKQLHERDCPFMDISDLSKMCREAGLADSSDEARKLVLAMDEAGDIIVFRNKVYLDPQQITELVAGALPLHLLSDDDPRMKEFEEMQNKLHEIELVTDRQVRKFLWFGLLALTAGTGLLVRLTFWELSWDVMEPIAFFLTSSFLIAGYAYFLFSRRDPTYQGLMHSLFASRRKRLMRSMKFDYERYKALEKQCISTCSPIKRVRLHHPHHPHHPHHYDD